MIGTKKENQWAAEQSYAAKKGGKKRKKGVFHSESSVLADEGRGKRPSSKIGKGEKGILTSLLSSFKERKREGKSGLLPPSSAET